MYTLNGVIWDMDGVLVDTGEFHYQSWVDTLSQFDIPFSRETFNETFGMNNEGILRLLLGDRYNHEVFKVINEQKESNFRQAIRGKVETLPGVIRLLTEIKEAPIPQAIGSSGPRANIDAIVSELVLHQYFQVIVSAAEMPSKPDPAVFLSAAQLMNVSPNHCVVIEDAIAGSDHYQ
jgi:beta-phosphoglucomutase